jgi:hypothetical protein
MRKGRRLALTLVLPALVSLFASCDPARGLPMENLRGDEIPKESWHEAIGSARLGGGCGDSADDPIEISTPEQFALFSKSVCDGETYEGKHIALTADIDLAGKRWVTIGKINTDEPNGEVRLFKGTFDGENHAVSNMIVFYNGRKDDWDSVGLFHTNKGVIKNLNLTNIHVENSMEVIAVGGLAGYNMDTGRILNCNVSGYVQGSMVGGFVGDNSGAIVNCSANVTVIGIQKGSGPEFSSHGLGGFVGVNQALIENCFAKGRLGASGKIENVGGFVGFCKDDFPYSNSRSSIKNCYGSMEFYIVSCGMKKGAFAGTASIAQISTMDNCYYNADIVSDLLPAAGFDVPSGRVTPLGTEEMKSESFVDILNRGDEAGPWIPDTATENEGYPVLDRNYAISEDEVPALNAFPSGQETTNRIFRVDADGNVEVESSSAESE